MNISDIRMVFPEYTIPSLEGYYGEYIDHWKQIFENRPPWQTTKIGGLYKKGSRRIGRLGTAKVLCDRFSELTFAEQCEITLDDARAQEYVLGVLEENGFWKHMPELLSVGYALGGCAAKIYVEHGKPRINYVHAGAFLPTEWTGKSITGGIFCATSRRGSRYYTLLELHRRGAVEYRLFRSQTAEHIGTRCALSELYDFDEVRHYGSDRPMFAYFKPACSNNAEYDVPIGMSIYANAEDTLQSLDTTFDSFGREFVLGKKRIIVPSSAIQTVVDPKSGELVTYFDTGDEAFVALKSDDNENLKIQDNTVSLRVQEHVSAINALLNILCFQVGLSAGTLSFDAVQGIKTATEVISQESITARTIKSNKNLLTEMLEDIIHAVLAAGMFLGDLPGRDYAVSVGWKDNIIIDDNTLIDNNIKLVESGLKSKLRAIMDVQKCDEKTAQEELKRIAEEQNVTGLSVDQFLRGGESDDTAGDDAAEPRAE